MSVAFTLGRFATGWVVRAAAAGLIALAGPTAGVAQSIENAERGRLTMDRLYSLPSLIGTAPRGFSWSRDGSKLAFLWNDVGRNFRDIWIVAAGNPDAGPRRVTNLPSMSAVPTDADDPFSVAEAETRAERDGGVSSVIWHPDGDRLLFSFRGDFWIVRPGGEPEQLTDTPVFESQPQYSPDGRTLAFLSGGDIWTLPADATRDDPPVRLTSHATDDVRLVGYQWSPTGTHIAVLEMDQSGVPVRGIPDYLTEEPRMARVRRAYPGEEPATHRVGIVRVSTESRPVDIAWIEIDPGATLGGRPDMILSYSWAPDGRRLAFDTSDLFAKDRRIFVVDIDDGMNARLVVREHDPLNETYYFWRIAWSRDASRIYYLSDREEDYHVWAVDPSDPAGTPEQLTEGSWAVSSLFPVEGGLIVVGNAPNPEERQLFFVRGNGGDPERLSQRPGTHDPVVSPDGRYAAVSFSADDTPPELLITRLGGDGGEWIVTHSPVAEFSDYTWATPEYVSFPSHVDGTQLHGRLTLPPDFDPTRRYPAILGSVYTDCVRNQWGGRTAHPTWGLDQFLVQEGYILLNVDMRGSWGRGREHRRGIRLDYGGMDIEDLESGVRFLETLGYVDMGKVGLWGSSYGGLMTTMSLFKKPGLYAAGIAGAPATNVWHALTGQMAVMLAPEDSPDEYAESSAYLHGHGLQDPLLFIHGMRDRVVLFKDTITLLHRLILLGKDVDLVVLPNAGHGWDNESLVQTRFAFKKMVEFFDRHLKGRAQ